MHMIDDKFKTQALEIEGFVYMDRSKVVQFYNHLLTHFDSNYICIDGAINETPKGFSKGYGLMLIMKSYITLLRVQTIERIHLEFLATIK